MAFNKHTSIRISLAAPLLIPFSGQIDSRNFISYGIGSRHVWSKKGFNVSHILPSREMNFLARNAADFVALCKVAVVFMFCCCYCRLLFVRFYYLYFILCICTFCRSICFRFWCVVNRLLRSFGILSLSFAISHLNVTLWLEYFLCNIKCNYHSTYSNNGCKQQSIFYHSVTATTLILWLSIHTFSRNPGIDYNVSADWEWGTEAFIFVRYLCIFVLYW